MPPIQLGSVPVQPDWVDFYGHVRGADYFRAFDSAGYVFYERFFGPVDDYLKNTGCGFFTAEAHVRYLKEVRGDLRLDIAAMLFDFDAKRIWWAMTMTCEGVERATIEIIDLHVDTGIGRTVPIPETVQVALAGAKATERPSWSGRSCSLDKR